MSMFGGLFNYLSKMEDPYRKPSKGLKNLICNTIANNIIYHTKDSYEPIFSYIYKYKLEILDDGYFFSTEIENTNPDKCSYHKMRRRGVFAGYAVSSNKSSPGWGRTTQIKIIGDTFRIGNRNKLKIKTSDLPNNNLLFELDTFISNGFIVKEHDNYFIILNDKLLSMFKNTEYEFVIDKSDEAVDRFYDPEYEKYLKNIKDL